jgi:hypothetical protein
MVGGRRGRNAGKELGADAMLLEAQQVGRTNLNSERQSHPAQGR